MFTIFVIIFGINTKPGMIKLENTETCNKLKLALAKEFQGFEVNIKVSPLHRY